MLDEDLYWVMPWMPCHKLRIFCIAKAEEFGPGCFKISFIPWPKHTILLSSLYISLTNVLLKKQGFFLVLVEMCLKMVTSSVCFPMKEDTDSVYSSKFTQPSWVAASLNMCKSVYSKQSCSAETTGGSSGRSGAFQQWCVWRPQQHCSLV